MSTDFILNSTDAVKQLAAHLNVEPLALAKRLASGALVDAVKQLECIAEHFGGWPHSSEVAGGGLDGLRFDEENPDE